MKKISIIVVLLLLIQIGSAGYWSEVKYDPGVDAECNGLYHVMCAEKDSSENYFKPLTRNISYTNYSGAEKTKNFCAIYKDGNDCSFELRNMAVPGTDVNDLEDLKDFNDLCDESPESRTYDGYSDFYDENCDGDEIFDMNEYGRLDTTVYIENNVSYNVSDRESNIDYFDIIVEDIGGIISGTITDINGDLVEDANLTLYFDNSQGTFKPYRSYVTGMDGFYTTQNDVDLWTYHRNITTDLIPRTDYIIIVNHPEYLESVSEVTLGIGTPFEDYNLTPDGGHPWLNHDIILDPVNLCQNDCTFLGGNVCRGECDGINGCNFKQVGDENLSVVLDGVPRGITVQREIDNVFYEIDTCEGEGISFDPINVESTNAPDCPPDQEVWKTTQLVRMDGQVVKMVVTLCQ